MKRWVHFETLSREDPRMSKQAFDKKLEAVEALRLEPDPAVKVDKLSKALRDRSNYLVSKAAELAADLNLSALIPDLLAAFDHFLTDPAKSDPQCWAKNAIAKALKNLRHLNAQVYLKGIVHVQLEPVSGGRADSAATLRGTCALATAAALSQLARPEGALLLRLKLLLGDKEPEVMGQCFTSLLSLTPLDSVPFIGRFLKAADEDVRLEAACTLAQSREPAAIEVLKGFWQDRLSPELRTAFLASLGASPLPEAAEFLLTIIASESAELAASALAALAASRFRTEMRDRTAAAIEAKQDANLKYIFEHKFPRTGISPS